MTTIINIIIYILIVSGTVAWILAHDGVNNNGFADGMAVFTGCLLFAAVDPIGSTIYYSNKYRDKY